MLLQYRCRNTSLIGQANPIAIDEAISQLNPPSSRSTKLDSADSTAMLRAASEMEQRQDEARWSSSFSRSVSPRISTRFLPVSSDALLLGTAKLTACKCSKRAITICQAPFTWEVMITRASSQATRPLSLSLSLSLSRTLLRLCV